VLEGTWGSETSQYPQEEKTNSDSVSSGERKRMVAKPVLCQAGRRCSVGVVGCDRRWAAACLMVVCGVSGRPLERVAVVGESPVRENVAHVMDCIPE
jgi:hypothetical protein